MNIAVITPLHKQDYLADTVIDGLSDLLRDNGTFLLSPSRYPVKRTEAKKAKSDAEFRAYAAKADFVLLIWGKDNTDFKRAEILQLWDKTIFIDGSEVGGNKRFDPKISKQIVEGTYEGNGAINNEMRAKCLLYARREKPYLPGIVPFPFAIESAYVAHYDQSIKKDIDFVCIFGQEEYPILRKLVREEVQRFAKENGFTAFTDRTKSRDEFYAILARAKVGVSVGGGGYDTARFWEILGNDCILLTETIDVFPERSKELAYERIHEFSGLSDFKKLLPEIGGYLRNEYDTKDRSMEYAEIMASHSAQARIKKLLEKAANQLYS